MSCNREAAEAHNKAGNTAYKDGDYIKAVDCYSKAIAAHAQAKYFTNRANAHLRLDNPQAALLDSDEALTLASSWIKAHYYKGVSLMQLGRAMEAKEVLWAGLRLDPNHVDMKAAIFKCNAFIGKAFHDGKLEQLQPPAEVTFTPEVAETRYQTSMKQVMALVKQQSYTAAANFTPRDFTLEELTPYFEISGAKAYLKARMLRDDAYKALQEQKLEVAVPKLAEGYCLEPRAMGCLTEDDLQGILLPLLSSYMKQHPRNVAGQLLRAFWSAPSQTGQWLAKRLQELEPKVPEKWRPGVLREVATICIRDDVADYEGAYQAAAQGLQVQPKDPDLLFYKAWAYKLLSFKRIGDDPCPGIGAPGFCSWVQKRVEDTTAVNKLFQDYLNMAPDRHSKVPNAYYYMAERVLCNRIVSRIPMHLGVSADVAVAEEATKLYYSGRAAEKALPPFYLPIVCASRESVPMLLEHHMPGFMAARSSNSCNGPTRWANRTSRQGRSNSNSISGSTSKPDGADRGSGSSSASPLNTSSSDAQQQAAPKSSARASSPTRKNKGGSGSATPVKRQPSDAGSNRSSRQGNSHSGSVSSKTEAADSGTAAQLNTGGSTPQAAAAGRPENSSSCSRSAVQAIMAAAGGQPAESCAGSSSSGKDSANSKYLAALAAESAQNTLQTTQFPVTAAAAAADDDYSCARCHARQQKLKRCAGCGVRYCSKECQMEDWQDGHRHICGRP